MTIDTRGWSLKDSTYQFQTNDTSSDRLLQTSDLPSPVESDIQDDDDMFDNTNSGASFMDQMIRHKDEERHRALFEAMNSTQNPQTSKENESIISEKLKSLRLDSQLSTSNLKTFPVKSSLDSEVNNKENEQIATETHADPDKISFALNNSNNLTIKTLANEANKANEVTIKLR